MNIVMRESTVACIGSRQENFPGFPMARVGTANVYSGYAIPTEVSGRLARPCRSRICSGDKQ
jgi:hypothetical protein